MRTMLILFSVWWSCSCFAATYNWTNVPNSTDYVADDVVNFYGTNVTPWSVTNSGTAGHPITFNIYAPHVQGTLTDSTGFITLNGRSDVILNSVGGYIILTNTGTSLGFQRNCYGVDLEGTLHRVTVSGFAMTNLYNRTSTADANYYGIGVNMTAGGGTDVVIARCTNFMASTGIGISWSGSCSNWCIWSNMCWQNVIALVMGESAANSTMDALDITGNDFGDMSQWSGQAGFHANNIHLYIGTFGTSQYIRTRVHGNYFHDPMSDHMTALTFFENNTSTANCYSNLEVFNNLYIYTNGNGSLAWNGFCFFKSVGALVANNTWVCNNHEIALETGTGGSTPNPGLVVTNNLTFNVTYGIYDPQGWVTASDYNNWSVSSGSITFGYPGNASASFAQWQGQGYDAHSTTTQPALDANYVPLSSDTVAKDKGVSMSTYFTTDRIGTTRPQGSAWDIGAYEYTSGGALPPAGGSGGVFRGGVFRGGVFK